VQGFEGVPSSQVWLTLEKMEVTHLSDSQAIKRPGQVRHQEWDPVDANAIGRLGIGEGDGDGGGGHESGSDEATAAEQNLIHPS